MLEPGASHGHWHHRNGLGGRQAFGRAREDRGSQGDRAGRGNTVRAAELARKAEASGWQPQVWDDPLVMLGKARLDAVLVLLPPHLHGDLERAIARSVPAALIEKPIATDLKTAEAAAEAFDKAGTLVSVGYMNRYRKTTAKVRELMAASAPVTIHGWWITEMPPPLWWRSKEQSGGQFVEQCTHLVDLARWIGGEIAEVSAFTTRGFVDDVPEYGVDDALTANVRFASGALGNFTTGCFPQGTASTGRGVDGVGMTFTSRTTQCTLTGWSLDLEWRNNAGGGQSLASDEDIFVVQDSALVQAAATGNRTGILSSYADGVRTLAVTLAAEESARTRRIVSL